jgi:hypothetical protein
MFQSLLGYTVNKSPSGSERPLTTPLQRFPASTIFYTTSNLLPGFARVLLVWPPDTSVAPVRPVPGIFPFPGPSLAQVLPMALSSSSHSMFHDLGKPKTFELLLKPLGGRRTPRLQVSHRHSYTFLQNL